MRISFSHKDRPHFCGKIRHTSLGKYFKWSYRQSYHIRTFNNYHYILHEHVARRARMNAHARTHTRTHARARTHTHNEFYNHDITSKSIDPIESNSCDMQRIQWTSPNLQSRTTHPQTSKVGPLYFSVRRPNLQSRTTLFLSSSPKPPKSDHFISQFVIYFIVSE